MHLPLPNSIIQSIGIFALSEFIVLASTYLYFYLTEGFADGTGGRFRESSQHSGLGSQQTMLDDIEQFLSSDNFQPSSNFGEHLKSEWNRTYGP